MNFSRNGFRTVTDNVATCSLLLTLTILAGIGAISYSTTQRFLQNDRQVAHTYQVLDGLNAILSDLQDAETGQRGYLLTGEPQYLQPYQSGIRAMPHDIQTVRTLTRDNPAQQRRLDTLQSLTAAKLAELDRTIVLRQQDEYTAALKRVRTGYGKAVMDQTRAVVTQMRLQETDLLAQRTAATEAAGLAARLWDGLGSAFAVLLIALAMRFVGSYLRQRERAEAENLRLAESARDAALQQRVFLKDVLSSVTEGRLALCDTADEMPELLPACGTPIPLSRSTGLRTLRQTASQAARACGFSEARVQDLATSVSEAGMNAITHGGGGEAVVCSDGGDQVQVRVVDRGKGIALDALPQSTLERGYSSAGTLGHGFWLMLRMVDKISLLTGTGGTTLVLEQSREAGEASWTQPETPQASQTFQTVPGGKGDSESDITNLSFKVISW